MRLLLFLVPLLWSSFHGWALADTHWVNPAGSNVPPYTSYVTGAYKIQDAMDIASAGDTVRLAAHEYDIDTTIVVPTSIVWMGAGQDSSVIKWVDLTYQVVRMASLGDNDEVLEIGFYNPRQSYYLAAHGLYLNFGRSDMIIHGCRFRECGIFSYGTGNQEVFNNEFYHGVEDGIRFLGYSIWVHHNTFCGKTSGDGIMCSSGNYVVAEHNVFVDDPTDPVPYEGRPDAVSIDYGTFIEVRNNLIMNCAGPVQWWYASGILENNTIIDATGGTNCCSPPRWIIPVFLRDYETLMIRNNIMVDFEALWEFGSYSNFDTTGWITFVHNAFWPPKDLHYRPWTEQPDALIKLMDSANFEAYPMFVDDSSYQLQVGSRLIDTGDPAVLDVDGSRSDIGIHGGPGGTAYAYQQLAPAAPESIWVSAEDHQVAVTWSSRPEADLAGYRVYRDTLAGFYYPGLTPIVETDPLDTSIIDAAFPEGKDLYYVVTALDTAGLESNPSPEGAAIFTGVFEEPGSAPLPLTPRILGVYPNPSNASTMIRVSLPAVGASPAPVQIYIYDILGRQVATAFDGSLGYGVREIEWAGRSDDGTSLASGMYFARLYVWWKPFGSSVKIIMLK